MSTDLEAQGPHTAHGRECGCPEWVVRCAHFGGRMAVLASASRTDRCLNPGPTTQFAVGIQADDQPLYPCWCGCGEMYWNPPASVSSDPTGWGKRRHPDYAGNDLAAAEAAFYEAEARLLAPTDTP